MIGAWKRKCNDHMLTVYIVSLRAPVISTHHGRQNK